MQPTANTEAGLPIANVKAGLPSATYTANPKKVIECQSYNYGKLPPAAGALDTTIILTDGAIKHKCISPLA